jgi:hypothetical protein
MTPRPPGQAELRAVAKLWGSKPEGAPTKPGMRLLSWKPLRKNSLLGFAAVELPTIGLKVHDIPVLASHNKIWASLPSKPQIDRDGQHKRDVNGKPVYAAILEWRDRDLSDRFSAAVVALIHAEYPDDLGGAP